MSRTIDLTTAMKEFYSMVQYELQNKERLQGCAREYDTSGEAFQLPILGQIDMEKQGSGPSGMDSGDIPISDVDQRSVVFQPSNFRVKNSIGNAYQTLFNFDIVQSYARQHAMSIARFNDYLKLQAAFGGTYNAANNNLVVKGTGTNVGLTVDKFAEAKFKLTANGADDGMLSLWTNAATIPKLLEDQRYSSIFYANQKAYTISGQQPPLLGVDIRTLSQVKSADGKVNNVIPIDGSGNTAAYMVWHDSIGVTYNRRPMSRVGVEEHQDRAYVLSVGTADSKITFPKAIVKIEIEV